MSKKILCLTGKDATPFSFFGKGRCESACSRKVIKLEDFKNGKLTDMLSEGIIDPVKVTRVALQNAASCAGTLITTNYGIIQIG